MPYYFECDYCNERQSVNDSSYGNHDQCCSDCGQDMCNICIADYDGRCGNCAARAEREADEAEKEQEAATDGE